MELNAIYINHSETIVFTEMRVQCWNNVLHIALLVICMTKRSGIWVGWLQFLT